MPTELEKKLKNLKIKQPERVAENIVLYPRGIVLKTPANASRKQIDLDQSLAGPKPLNIEKLVKNKKSKTDSKVIKKKNIRAGKKHQLQKEVEKYKQLIKICVTDEARDTYTVLLNKSKNNLNRLRKGKKIFE